jgi:hypothetical protein
LLFMCLYIFTGGFMALILPETLGSTLPDTFQVRHKGSYCTPTQNVVFRFKSVGYYGIS